MYNGMEMMNMLNEKELENVTGGKRAVITGKGKTSNKPMAAANIVATNIIATNSAAATASGVQNIPFACQKCGQTFNADMSLSEQVCPHCHKTNYFSG